jgi:hypothetical protein
MEQQGIKNTHPPFIDKKQFNILKNSCHPIEKAVLKPAFLLDPI